MTQQYNSVNLKNKWSMILKIELDENDWINIYKVYFSCIKKNDLIWFKFQMIQRILGTKAYLHKVKISDSPSCTISDMAN